MIGLNLLPDVKKEYLKAQRTRNMVVVGAILTVLGAGALTILLAAFVYGGQKLIIDNLTGQIAENQEMFEKKENVGTYLTVQNQLSALDTLHDQKSIYSRLFGYLQKLNPAAPDSMTVSSVAIDKTTSIISIQGTTADFKSLDVVKSTLENAELLYRQGDLDNSTPLFTSVNLLSASLSQATPDKAGVVSFDFQLGFAPEAFTPSSTNTDVVVPKLTPSSNEGGQ